MVSERKFFVGGNWKMNGNKKEIEGIINFLTAGPLDPNTGMSIYNRYLLHYLLNIIITMHMYYHFALI